MGAVLIYHYYKGNKIMFQLEGYSTENLKVAFKYGEPQFYDDGTKGGTMIQLRECQISDGTPDLIFATTTGWYEVGTEKERTRKQLLRQSLFSVFPGPLYRQYRAQVWKAYFEAKKPPEKVRLLPWRIRESTFWDRLKRLFKSDYIAEMVDDEDITL